MWTLTQTVFSYKNENFSLLGTAMPKWTCNSLTLPQIPCTVPPLFTQPTYTVKFSTMIEIDLYRYLSCLQWTPWYQEKLTNWDFSLCFLANILFYNYKQFSSSLMVTFHLCVDFFHKQQHQYFVSIVKPMQGVQDVPLQEKNIPEIYLIFPSF